MILSCFYTLTTGLNSGEYYSLGSEDGERIKKYKDYLAARVTDDKIKEIQKSTQGQSHYFYLKFEEQIKMLLPMKRKRGRPRKVDFVDKSLPCN